MSFQSKKAVENYIIFVGTPTGLILSLGSMYGISNLQKEILHDKGSGITNNTPLAILQIGFILMLIVNLSLFFSGLKLAYDRIKNLN